MSNFVREHLGISDRHRLCPDPYADLATSLVTVDSYRAPK